VRLRQKKTTARHGKPFTKTQVRTHIAVAILTLLQLLQQYGSESAEVAIALPNDNNHRSIVLSIIKQLERLGIKVLFVNTDHSVEVCI